MQNETATGSSSSSRVRTTLTVQVESIDFDTQACVLRLKGRNKEENQFVKVRRKLSLLDAENSNINFSLDGCLSYIRLGTESQVHNYKT